MCNCCHITFLFILVLSSWIATFVYVENDFTALHLSKTHRWTSFGGLHTCTPTALFLPHNVTEIISILAEATKRERHCKVVGAGHSWSSIGLTNDYLINLDKMNAVLEINKNKLEVTVEAGIRIRDLSDALAAEGLALKNTGVISAQSVAGAIGTATHGSGIDYPTMSDSVVSLEMVFADGTVRVLSESDGVLFKAAQVHLGALGVVTKVTLSCVPKYSAWKKNPVTNVIKLMPNLDELVHNHHHALLWWIPYQNMAQMLHINRTEYKQTDVAGASMINIGGIKMRVISAVIWFSSLLPVWTVPYINVYLSAPILNFLCDEDGYFEQEGHLSMLNGHPDNYDEMEYFIPSHRFHDAFNEFYELLEKKKETLGANHIVQFRWTRCDDILMSPYYQVNCETNPNYFVAIAILSRGFSRGYFTLAEEIFLKYGGKPHWGKTHFLGKKELELLYGDNFKLFLSIREEVDPKGLFLNDHLRNLFFD